MRKLLQRIRHTLTFHHWRYNRSMTLWQHIHGVDAYDSELAFCTCGWKAKWVKEMLDKDVEPYLEDWSKV